MQAFWMAMHGDPKNEDVHMNTHKKRTKQKGFARIIVLFELNLLSRSCRSTVELIWQSTETQR